MCENGPKYDNAARAAAEIVNLLNPSEPKAVQYGRILFTILHAMYAADDGVTGRRFQPSDN